MKEERGIMCWHVLKKISQKVHIWSEDTEKYVTNIWIFTGAIKSPTIFTWIFLSSITTIHGLDHTVPVHRWRNWRRLKILPVVSQVVLWVEPELVP